MIGKVCPLVNMTGQRECKKYKYLTISLWLALLCAVFKYHKSQLLDVQLYYFTSLLTWPKNPRLAILQNAVLIVFLFA